MANTVFLSACVMILLATGISGQGVYNVALNKTYNQSSYHNAFGQSPWNAANGNRDGELSKNNCIHTSAGDRNPFWKVDLGRDYPIVNITLYGRTRSSERLAGVAVKVDQEECIQIKDDPKNLTVELSCDQTIFGRTVYVTRKDNTSLIDENNVINICEVQIWVCAVGYFGDKCDQPCGKCVNGVCSRYGGACRNGWCQPGYAGHTCMDNCKGGSFGENCSSKCGRCKDQQACHHVDGRCVQGCAPGWIPPMCVDRCKVGFFGNNCSQMCANCLNGTDCHHATGVCENGCAEGYTGSTCAEDLESVNRLRSASILTAVFVVLVLLIVAVIVMVIFIKRRRAKQKYASGNVLSEDRKIKQLSSDNFGGVKGTSLKSQCPQTTSSSDTTYQNVSHVAQVLQPDTPPAEGNVGKDQTGLNTTDENVIDMETDDVQDEEAKTVEETYAQVTKFHAATVALKSLHKYVIENRRNEKLHEEFLNLPSGLIHDCDNGKKNENRLKNRFNSILPYDSSRVILQDNGNDTSDYINASIIRGYKQSKGYIAAQGPKENTVDDFWRMVWQEEITQIIMLTVLSENMKRKCYEYWPGTSESKIYGNVEVKCVDQQQRSHSVIRSFDIRLNNSSTSRRVEQYHYTSWMDHSAPCALHLVDFWRDVKTRARARHNPASPPLVHCSAGVGRTGTYIALDLIMEQSCHEGKVSFFKVVRSLRDDRCSMVQNKDQYTFLHEAVLEAYNREKTVLDLPSFDLTFPDAITSTKPNKRIGKEFQIIQSMRSLLEPPTHNIASALENRAKNRNPYALPADNYLVRLSLPSLKKDSYINAVYVPTMLSVRGCVLTQLPLPDTARDLWRLVSSCEVATIVSLGEAHNPDEDLALFWPMEKGQTVTTDYYSVSCISREQRGSSLDSYYLKLQHKQGQSEVRLLHHKDWNSKIPASTEDVLQLVALLEDTLHDKGENPLLIQCIDGASRSGLFSALYDIILRMTYNHVVDVYSAVRNVHVVRPEAVTSLEEYRFLYEVAQQYRHSHQIYANT